MGGMGLPLLGVPVMGGANVVTPPAGFDNFTVPFAILYAGSSFRPASSWAIEALAPTGAGVYYVDNAGGNDANPGTAAQPLASIATAINKADVDIIYIKPGLYHRSSGGPAGATIDRSISIYPWPGVAGTVVITCAQADLVWALDETLTHTYKATRSGVYNVIDASLTDANGDYTRLTRRANAAAVEAAAGSWYLDGSNVLWVRTADDRAPDADLWPMVAGNGYMAANVTVYMQDLHWYGGQTGAFRARDGGASQTPKFYAKGCHFAYSAANGLTVSGCSEAIIQACHAYANDQDGFNYHAENSIVPNVIEIDCIGRNNGTADGTGNDNGSAMHDGGNIVRINGQYYGNIGPNVIDTGAGEVWCLGSQALNSASDVAGSDHGFSITGTMWLDRCVATGNVTDLVASEASTIYQHLCTYVAAGGAGTVTAYKAPLARGVRTQ